LFRSATGVDMVHVPYRGGGPAVTDLLGGQVMVYFGTFASTIENVRAGRLRARGVTSATRAAVLPDVPAMAEFLPGFEASIFVGIAAPRGTPANIVETLNRTINLALADAAVTRRIAELGDTPLSLSPSDFAKLVGDENRKMAQGNPGGAYQGGVGEADDATIASRHNHGDCFAPSIAMATAASEQMRGVKGNAAVRRRRRP